MNAPALLDAVLAIAVEAGDRILKIYDSEYAVAHKDDNSPLTEADLAGHACIVGSTMVIRSSASSTRRRWASPISAAWASAPSASRRA
jgi:hypothetical protein